MRFALTISVIFLIAAGQPNRWLRLSDTNQGRRFVDLASAKRVGDRASVDTELRMRPVIKQREHFSCSKRLMLVLFYTQTNYHEPALSPAGKMWASVKDVQDGPAMLRLACRLSH